MSHIKTFVTLFPDARNFHLVKDVGQLPYFMHKTEGFEATIVCYRNDEDYPFLNNEVKGLKIHFIANEGRVLYFEKALLNYIRSFAKSIDVLHLFHFKKEYILYLWLYKSLNPKGKVYIKLDVDIKFFKNYNTFLYSKYSPKSWLLNRITRNIFHLTDIFSVESEEARDHLISIYPELGKKLLVIPNGVDNNFIDDNVKLLPWDEKENIIITIGRIGTFQKNTELLIESFARAETGDWLLYVIGPIEGDFQKYITEFYVRNPRMREKVVFTGNITDRIEIFRWYNRAKIFCLSSRFEGFPIVYAEALYFGNYLITTPVSGALEITDNGRLGKIAEPTVPEFSAAIQESIQDQSLNAVGYEERLEYARNKFTWPRITESLTEKLGRNA